MAQHLDNPIREALKALLPAHHVRSVARQVGAVERERKIDIVQFVWSLALGFTGGSERTLAGLRRAFEHATGTRVVPSSFYDRFTPSLAKLLKRLAVESMRMLTPGRNSAGTLSAFREVLVADATVLRLHDLLKRAYRACRTNHTQAAAKLHILINVTARGARSVKLTGERSHEGRLMRAGRWMRDRLLMFDLGYYRFQLFDCIHRQGGYFLTRLKENANPLITHVYSALGTQDPLDLVGRRLQDVLWGMKPDYAPLDLKVEVDFSRRTYRGARSRAHGCFRVVAIPNAETGRFHLYLTNVPQERLAAHEVASLYAARWEVELLFRELKSCYRIDDLPSAKRPVIESLIYASMLTLAASRTVYGVVAARMKGLAHRLPWERWAAVFTQVAFDVLEIAVRPRSEHAVLARRVHRFLRHEAVDPNAGRALLWQRASTGRASIWQPEAA